MEHCINKFTNVIVFCSTYNSDYNWIAIKKWLEDKKQPHMFFNSIFDSDGSSNVQTLIDKITDND